MSRENILLTTLCVYGGAAFAGCYNIIFGPSSKCHNYSTAYPIVSIPIGVATLFATYLRWKKYPIEHLRQGTIDRTYDSPYSNYEYLTPSGLCFGSATISSGVSLLVKQNMHCALSTQALPILWIALSSLTLIGTLYGVYKYRKINAQQVLPGHTPLLEETIGVSMVAIDLQPNQI